MSASPSLSADVIAPNRLSSVVGRSAPMQAVFDTVRRVAPHYRTVLITGMTGTGKDLIAGAFHQLSPVSNGPYVVCNCSAIVETLFESELFGYVRGAFTGAFHDKRGLIECAHGGSLFLDEIGDMSLTTQAKLLRVLQNHEVHRVGAVEPRRVDVRIIAATNRNLRELVAKREFREDLYYRLSMLEVTLPPLAEREGDILLLIRHFVARFAAQYGKRIRCVTRRAEAALCRYSWPGNVRELENVIGHACLVVEGDAIDLDDLPPAVHGESGQGSFEEPGFVSLAELSRRYAHSVTQRVGDNKSKAASLLGVSRATLYRLLATEARERHC